MNLDLNSLQTAILPISVSSTETPGTIDLEEHAPQLPINQELWSDESLINPSDTSTMEETSAHHAEPLQNQSLNILSLEDPHSDPHSQNLIAGENPASDRVSISRVDRNSCQIQPQPHYVQGVIRGQQAYIITNLYDRTSSTLFQPQMTWSIGRNRDAAIPLRDRMLSRHHSALMYVRNSGFHLLDLNSMNGSYVNGERVENRHQLRDGDLVRVGNTEFFFFLSSGYRNLDALHPEILRRLVNPEMKVSHVDYAELKEEISFNLNRS